MTAVSGGHVPWIDVEDALAVILRLTPEHAAYSFSWVKCFRNDLKPYWRTGFTCATQQRVYAYLVSLPGQISNARARIAGSTREPRARGDGGLGITDLTLTGSNRTDSI
ncbi:hypothetical protein JCM11491_001432 [Sporobolomyces phaffii]